MSEACEGAVIEDMTDEELRSSYRTFLYGKSFNRSTRSVSRAWQERGNIVAMTGDGVNDARHRSRQISELLWESREVKWRKMAAMVLTDDNFATIVKAVENGRNIYQNIKMRFSSLLSENFAAILAVLYASLATSAGSICTGTSVVHQPSDRQPAGDRPWTGAAFQK